MSRENHYRDLKASIRQQTAFELAYLLIGFYHVYIFIIYESVS